MCECSVQSCFLFRCGFLLHVTGAPITACGKWSARVVSTRPPGPAPLPRPAPATLRGQGDASGRVSGRSCLRESFIGRLIPPERLAFAASAAVLRVLRALRAARPSRRRHVQVRRYCARCRAGRKRVQRTRPGGIIGAIRFQSTVGLTLRNRGCSSAQRPSSSVTLRPGYCMWRRQLPKNVCRGDEGRTAPEEARSPAAAISLRARQSGTG